MWKTGEQDCRDLWVNIKQSSIILTGIGESLHENIEEPSDKILYTWLKNDQYLEQESTIYPGSVNTHMQNHIIITLFKINKKYLNWREEEGRK